MAANNKNPIEDAHGTDPAPDTGILGGEADTEASPPTLSPEEEAVAVELADAAIAAEQNASSDKAEPADEPDDEVEDTGKPFPPAPPVEGEFLVPASQLEVSAHHPRRGSRRRGEHASALALTAAEPFALRPLTVVRQEDGSYAVTNGRFRLEAVRAAHPGNRDVEVRCVLFAGTEAEAVAEICDETLGTVAMTRIEQARALYSLQQMCGVSMAEILKRYPHFRKISNINNRTRAARVWEEWPALFDILEKPDRVSIDYGVKLFTLMKRLDADGKAALLDRASDIVANGERFSPTEALKALQVDTDDQGDGDTASDDIESREEDTPDAEDIFGVDDQPLGTAEQVSGERLRLTMPSSTEIAAMSASEREENAAPFLARVRQHFGLESEG